MKPHRLERADWLISAALFFMTFALYAQTIGFAFVNYDDNHYVYDNPHIQSGLTFATLRNCFTQITSSNWHPITMLSHALDVELFGLTPAGPHGVNAFLHAANAALLFAALLKLTGARWPSALAAGLFAWHPQRVESVAWISERKDLLSGLFFMLALLAYVRYVAKPSPARYGLILLTLLLGLFSKPMLVTLPCVLLLLDAWPLGRLKNWSWRDVSALVIEKLPLLLLALLASAVTIIAQRSGRSVASTSVLPPFDRLSNAAVAIVQYLRQFVWPTDLAPLYWHPWIAPSEGLPALTVALSAAGVVCLTVGAVMLWRRAPWLTIGWLWFVGMLIPVLGLVQVGWQGRADRYTYLPMIGIAIAIAWTMRHLLPRAGAARFAVIVTCGAMLTACAAMTLQQTRHWRDSVSLWTRALVVQPPNSIALNNLGTAFAAAGDNARAMEAFQRAIAINPRAAEAMKNLANQHLARNDDRAAKPLLRNALQANPALIEAYSTLAGIYLREGRPSAAIMLYEQAVRRDPGYADGFYNLAVTLGQQGDYSQAIEHLQRVLQLRPDDAEAARALAFARQQVLALQESENIPTTRPNE